MTAPTETAGDLCLLAATAARTAREIVSETAPTALAEIVYAGVLAYAHIWVMLDHERWPDVEDVMPSTTLGDVVAQAAMNTLGEEGRARVRRWLNDRWDLVLERTNRLLDVGWAWKAGTCALPSVEDSAM
ncbi:hypothetical protein [Mycobacterium sp. OTB74]|uniref:hypothetical protein n=1 Tax=Mycobacterium sp. OTB74 TaxID=1853452 RepID=UPI002474D1B1|nr:hypothetical protein [Mycobacterium sp. OTB74]MDH6245473.1 hypothetical protein [Mycobacterium sp. OTB74]